MRPDLGLRVRIVFAEAYARGHVHELAHRGVAEGRGRQLGHVLRHAARGVELPLGSQHGRQRPDEGLGHRHGAVLAFGLEHAEVALIDHAAFVQHHDAVGVVGLERIAPGHGLAGPQWREAQLVDVFADRKSTRLNSSHSQISYAVFCLKKKNPTVLAVSQGHPFAELPTLYCTRRSPMIDISWRRRQPYRPNWTTTHPNSPHRSRQRWRL